MKKILFLGLFLLPSMALATIDVNLKYGARGAEVTELQEFLIDKGFLTGTATGNFFSLTRKAVVVYQSSVGLPNTGFVGILTRGKINAELSLADTSSTQAEMAETGTTTQPTNTNQLSTLNQQIAELNKKLEEQKQIQQQTQNTLQQTQQNIQQIQENTTPTPTPVTPTIIKPIPSSMKVEVYSAGRDYMWGGYCGQGNLVVYIFNENGNKIVGQPYYFIDPNNGIKYSGKSIDTFMGNSDVRFELPQLSGEAIVTVSSENLFATTSIKIKPFLEEPNLKFIKESDTRWIEQSSGTVVNPQTGMCRN